MIRFLFCNIQYLQISIISIRRLRLLIENRLNDRHATFGQYTHKHTHTHAEFKKETFRTNVVMSVLTKHRVGQMSVDQMVFWQKTWQQRMNFSQ